MATIDADAHVVESEHTWDYMDPAERKYRTRQAGTGVLMIGTDYGHQDMSVELDALRTLGARGTWPRWPPRRFWTITRGRCMGCRSPSHSQLHARHRRVRPRSPQREASGVSGGYQALSCDIVRSRISCGMLGYSTRRKSS